MQISPDKKAERCRIQRHLRGPTSLCQPTFGKVLRPLSAVLIVVRQYDPMRPVPHPIHEAQRHIVEDVFVQVIFEQHKGTADPHGFAKQNRRVLRVMEHIHEETNVERGIRKG